MPSKFPCLGQKKLKYIATSPYSNGFLQSFIKLHSHTGPASAQFLKEAISSVLCTGMGSCNSGSGWVAGGVTNSGLGVGVGVVLGPAPGVPTGSGWAPVG